MEELQIGQRVRVVSLPPLEGMDPTARAALEYALGKELRIEGFGRYGHAELVLGPEADALLGGFMNTVWLETEHLAPVGDP